MGSEEQPLQRGHETGVTAEIAALSARVEALERELAQLRQHMQPAPSPPPPPKAIPAPILPSIPQAASQPHTKPAVSLEDRIGSQLFSRIGIIALLIATTLFLKWAIDNHWIGPVGRILAGLLAGAAVILWSERFRSRGFAAFSYSLKAIGSGALYLSLWAAFQLYHLLSPELALVAMLAVTVWNAYMAWSQNSQVLAAYALAGAFATPALLATGGNHEISLFLYLLIADIATALLVRLKPWPRLLLGAFPATVLYFTTWYFDWHGILNQPNPLAITSLFSALFFLTFILPSVYRQEPATRPRGQSIVQILLPIANAAFAVLSFYSMFDTASQHGFLPWLAVLFAAVYLGLMRLPQPQATSAIHLSLAIVFLTVAVPLKASGSAITIGWLAEGAALLWVASRLSNQPASNKLLRRLASAALTLGFLSVFLQPCFEPITSSQEAAFFNAHFATALFGLAVFAGAAWIALHAPSQPQTSFPTWLEIAAASIIAFNLIAVVSVVRELYHLWPIAAPISSESGLQRALSISAFLMLYGGLLLAVGFWRRSAFIRWQALILLIFSIFKTFLYDLSSLSQGYRILSFLGLGALLMAISFAYQKDWLSLRTPTPHEEANQ